MQPKNENPAGEGGAPKNTDQAGASINPENITPRLILQGYRPEHFLKRTVFADLLLDELVSAIELFRTIATKLEDLGPEGGEA